MPWQRRRGDAGGQRLRLFVASDVHGSDVCWGKFLNAGRFYRVDAILLAGDLTGKALVPVVREPHKRFRVRFMGREQILGPDEIDEAERIVRFNGFYPYRCDPEELAVLSEDPNALSTALESAVRAQLERWVVLAAERLAGSDIQAFVMPGNDDELFVSEILDASTAFANQDGRVLHVGDYQIAGCGWSNPTPWDTPREKPEEVLVDELSALVEAVDDRRSLIFNPHVPPYDSGIDLAPELREDLTMVTRAGQPHMVPVGSRAVRRVIERFQPLLSVSGHVHESKGVVRLAETTCINPGSEYNVGRLPGAIVELRNQEVRNVQLVTG
jgi:Icc-related predicted phosphoesterase